MQKMLLHKTKMCDLTTCFPRAIHFFRIKIYIEYLDTMKIQFQTRELVELLSATTNSLVRKNTRLGCKK